MNRSMWVITTIFAFLLLIITGCGDDEPFVTTKLIESQIYGEIKTYREAAGKTGPFVQQFIMVKEAQLFSAKMAAGVNDVDTTGIAVHWDIIDDKLWGGYNQVTLVQSTPDVNPAGIVQAWAENPLTNPVLLGDYTQCGVGVEYDNDQVAYVTVMMMKVDS
ncbi:MAG: hypothetical protein P1P82_01440 [Bacteroidales bacterium]|nr:hypothetical protein [Bacteroidales bacterium]MDT8430210.1 hypothetical protein [Bacteroidales bacterium]